MTPAERTIGKFLIRTTEDGTSVFVRFGERLIFCDNFDNDMNAALVYVERNKKGAIKVIDGEFYSK